MVDKYQCFSNIKKAKGKGGGKMYIKDRRYALASKMQLFLEEYARYIPYLRDIYKYQSYKNDAYDYKAYTDMFDIWLQAQFNQKYLYLVDRSLFELWKSIKQIALSHFAIKIEGFMAPNDLFTTILQKIYFDLVDDLVDSAVLKEAIVHEVILRPYGWEFVDKVELRLFDGAQNRLDVDMKYSIVEINNEMDVEILKETIDDMVNITEVK